MEQVVLVRNGVKKLWKKSDVEVLKPRGWAELPAPAPTAPPPAENTGPTYKEKVEFIQSKGVEITSRKGPDVDAQYQALLTAEKGAE